MSIQLSIQSQLQLVGYSTLFSAFLWGAPLVQAQEIRTRYQYPEPTVDGFVTQCSQEPSDLPASVKKQLCGCLVTEFQNKYTFESFQAIGKQVQAGQPMPGEMAAVITQCVERVMLKQALRFPETQLPETMPETTPETTIVAL